MAIVDDITKDKRTLNVLNQTNTKTVSNPPSSTGLVGDQTPASVFSVDDFDLVKNQVHLEAKNYQLMEALNTMGQLTNMQSQSGPIPGTMSIKTHAASGAENPTVFRPAAGQVWLLGPLSLDPEGSGAYRAIPTLNDDDGNAVEIADVSGTGSAEAFVAVDWASPIYVTYDVYFKVNFITVDTSLTAKISVVRVR